MEHNIPIMVLSHQNRHQGRECQMEQEDSPWAGDALRLLIEANSILPKNLQA